jgi:hypothetical protein
MNLFEIGDNVAVTNNGSAFSGRVGTVVGITVSKLKPVMFQVALEPAERHGQKLPPVRVAFLTSELETFDPSITE